MTLAQQARDFRTLTDEQYADILNGRASAAEMLAKIETARRVWAEQIARAVASDAWAATNQTGPDRSHVYNVALGAARAAALQALTEMENQK